MQEFTIVAFNAHSCVGSDSKYSLERIVETVASQDPDIVCLQEIEDNSNAAPGSTQKTRLWSVPHATHQPKEIAARLGFEYTYFVPAVTSRVLRSSSMMPEFEKHNDGHADAGGFGNAIISKYPILKMKEYSYSPFPNKTPRNILACLIQLSNNVDKVWVVTTHLGVHLTGAEQYHQTKELVEFLDSLETNDTGNDVAGVVLCGDFNSMPWYRCMRLLTDNRMQDAWDDTNRGGSTFPSAGLPIPLLGSWVPPSFRLDYIFFKPNNSFHDDKGGDRAARMGARHMIVVRKEHGIDIAASDHLALRATFFVAKS